jgi:hypothetical protein
MKKILFGLIAMVMLGFVGNAQEKTSKEEWSKMMDEVKIYTEEILRSECPKDMDFKIFKSRIFNGEIKLSKGATEKLISLSSPLKSYGKEFAVANNLNTADDNELIFYATFSPDVTISDKGIIQFPPSYGFTTNSVIDCALGALGLDFLYGSAFEGAVGWGIKAITRAFTRIAIRMLGPVGVLIAVVEFTRCLTH